MHIPDGFLDVPTSAGAAIVAAAGVGVCLRRSRQQLDDRTVPLAGMVAATVFALQMLNFPVASGTSGHLMGGALAAILVGPSMGALCVTVVLAVQALLFADGGLSALGLNVVNLALIGVGIGYASFWLARRMLPERPGSIVAASAFAGTVSVLASSLAFCLEYALGGATGVPLATVSLAMIGVHLLIGIGEGIITATIVASVMATRPDLVWGASDLVGTRPAPRPAEHPA
ncbi:MAG TPA: energy-coupling factor ABC transporter permease [Microthrixaceae bacterium]|nr:energy-coupling factor ABC transporter permease [Microthrixaceae bacterium]